MNLSEYLETFDKDDCPANCVLKSNNMLDIVSIPLPDEIAGIIVSSDPTTNWPYRHLKGNKDLLFASAIPLTLLKQIFIFMQNRIDEDTEKSIFNTIFHKTYWTHLHKCQTDNKNHMSIRFNVKNANRCADNWLDKELSYAINDKTKFIITLGNNVRNWITKWNELKGQGIAIINLPHPSGNNNSIWHRSEKTDQNKINSTDEQINQLIDICRSL